ncbi:hypothetical protein ACFWY5_22060 [Nonomuraea sp. NPDC059007]|uniref:hypothetical protein n=1 Tax=Nonomuraea sp. NPDC059007 TaxID=3346692 RepID=UPI0036BE681A
MDAEPIVLLNPRIVSACADSDEQYEGFLSFLDQVQAAAIRADYAATLTRLTALADPGPPGNWRPRTTPGDGALEHRGGRHLSALETLFTDSSHALRERLLWRMLYETAARAEEILILNIEDLDLEFRRAHVVSKGGAIEYVHWPLRRLPDARGHRHLPGNRTGPLVLPARRIPVQTGQRRTRHAPERLDAPPTAPQPPCCTSPRPGIVRPSSRPNPATSTWPASAATSASARRPPPVWPPKPTRPPAAKALNCADHPKLDYGELSFFGGISEPIRRVSWPTG